KVLFKLIATASIPTFCTTSTAERERVADRASGRTPRGVTPARPHSDIEPGRPNEFFHRNDKPRDLLSPSRARSGRFAAVSERERKGSNPRARLHGRRHKEEVRARRAMG